MKQSTQVSDRPKPKEIRRNGRTYRRGPGESYYCKEADEVLDAILVAAACNGNGATYGCTVPGEKSDLTPGGGNFSGAGASVDIDLDTSNGSNATPVGGD